MSPDSILIAILAVTATLAIGQDVTSELTPGLRQRPDDLLKESRISHSSSVLTPLKSPMLEEPYRLITPSERLRWFVTGTIEPAHMAGVGFLSAGGNGRESATRIRTSLARRRRALRSRNGRECRRKCN